MKALAGCLLSAVLASSAVAEVYFGGGVGRTDFDVSLVGDATGFNVRGGWQYNPFVAFESSYWHSGDGDLLGYDFYADAVLFGGRFSTDIRQPFQAYARVGMGRWDAKAPGASLDGTDLYYAIGAAYTADRGRYFVEFQTLEADGEGGNLDVSSLSAGFEYRCCALSSTRYSAISSESGTTTYSQPVSRPANYVLPKAGEAPQTSVIIEDLDAIASNSAEPQTVSYSETFPAPSSRADSSTAEPGESERIHPMKIAINEGCNVMSVKIVDGSEVWDLFCPKTLQRLTVTI